MSLAIRRKKQATLILRRTKCVFDVNYNARVYEKHTLLLSILVSLIFRYYNYIISCHIYPHERKMPMRYEKANLSDIPQLIDLRLAYLTEDHGPLDENETTIIKKDLPDYFQRQLNDCLFVYTGKDEDVIVSTVFLLLEEKPMSPSFLNGKTGTILNVYTLPKYRHQGIAKQLIQQMQRDAKDMQISVIKLDATEDGYPLYKKVGFIDDTSKYHPMKWHPAN